MKQYLPAEKEKAEELRDSIYETVARLLNAHIEFDLCDERIFDASVSNGVLTYKQKQYSAVLYPDFDGYTKDFSEKLAQLKAQKVPVIKAAGSYEEICKQSGCEFTDITVSPAFDNIDFITYKKILPDSLLITCFNNSPKKTEIVLQEKGFCSVLNVDTMQFQPAEKTLRFSGYESKILKLTEEKSEHAPYLQSEWQDTLFRHYDYSEWNYTPKHPNLKASVFYWDIRITDQYQLKTEVSDHLFCLIRDLIGSHRTFSIQNGTIPGFDAAAFINHYPVDAEFETTVTLPHSHFSMLYESETFRGEMEFFVNENKVDWNTSSNFRVYDENNRIISLSRLLKPGKNTLRIQMRQAGEFDGIRSGIYFLEEEGV